MTTAAGKVTLPYANPSDSGQYAADIDAALGAPDGGTNLAVTSAWVQAESPTFPGWNGLGTELQLPGATPDPSNPAVYDYKSLSSGVQAAVDMMTGTAPQSSPDAPQFVADLQSGSASQSQLVADVYNSHWAGTSTPDAYDANTISAELSSGTFTVAGKPGSGGATPINAQTTSVLSSVGGALGVPSSSSIEKIVLEVAFVVLGSALVVVGAYITTGKSAPKPVAGLEKALPEAIAA